MPIQTFFAASGVLVHPGARGRLYTNIGIIDCIAPPSGGFDSHLFASLKIWVDATGSWIQINSTTGGVHVVGSRHWKHLAIDSWRIGPAPRSQPPLADAPPPATLDNPHAVAAVDWLAAEGFRHREGGPWPCVLLGPPRTSRNETAIEHKGHIHFSCYPVR